MAPPSVHVQRNRNDFHRLLDSCVVSVSQGGYNTVVDLLALRVPAVLVPYEDEREHEQAVRVRALAERAVVKMVPYPELTPATLAQAISAVIDGDPMPTLGINLDGARTSARLIVHAACERMAGATIEECGL
jgi:predicted glycosyltransferase